MQLGGGTQRHQSRRRGWTEAHPRESSPAHHADDGPADRLQHDSGRRGEGGGDATLTMGVKQGAQWQTGAAGRLETERSQVHIV